MAIPKEGASVQDALDVADVGNVMQIANGLDAESIRMMELLNPGWRYADYKRQMEARRAAQAKENAELGVIEGGAAS